MREVYTARRYAFPENGALLFLIKKIGERLEIEQEMMHLAAQVIRKAKEENSGAEVA